MRWAGGRASVDSETPGGRAPSGPWLVVALVLLVVPIAVDLLVSDRRRPFDYASADAFYYLTIARNIAEHASLSFDREHPTNGFQPAWQLALAGTFTAGDRLGFEPHDQLMVALVLGVALIGGALWLLARTLKRSRGEISG